MNQLQVYTYPHIPSAHRLLERRRAFCGMVLMEEIVALIQRHTCAIPELGKALPRALFQKTELGKARRKWKGWYPHI